MTAQDGARRRKTAQDGARRRMTAQDGARRRKTTQDGARRRKTTQIQQLISFDCEGSKSRLTKAAGTESYRQIRNKNYMPFQARNKFQIKIYKIN